MGPQSPDGGPCALGGYFYNFRIHTKMTIIYRRLGLSRIVIFPSAAREQNSGHDTLPEKFWTPLV